MLTWKKTAAGSIREENQDVLLFREDQGIMVLANGGGPSGKEAAELVSDFLADRLWKVRLQASVDSSKDRVENAFAEAVQYFNDIKINRPGFRTCRVDLAASCLVEGNLFLGVTGTCGILSRSNDKVCRLDPTGVPSLKSVIEGADTTVQPESSSGTSPRIVGPIPIKVGDWVLAFTEGLLISQPIEEIQPISSQFHTEPETFAEGIFIRASKRYDGDDRTLAMIRFLPPDLKSVNSDDQVIETHVDKTFSIPVWAAFVALAVGSALLYLFNRLGLFLDDE